MKFLFLILLISVSANAADVSIDFSTGHVFTDTGPQVIAVTVSDPGSPVYTQWLSPDGAALTAREAIPLNQSAALVLPSPDIGHYDLQFTSDNATVRFPPQDAGHPKIYGFSVLPEKSIAERSHDIGSYFAMIHADTTDPYLAGWVKRKTWNTNSPGSFAADVLLFQAEHGLQELPIVNGTDWSWNDDQQITAQFLNTMGNRFGTYLDALISQGAVVPIWQLGIEEDDGAPFYYANLAAKAARIRAELDARGLTDVELMNSFVNDYDGSDFLSFAQSEAAQHFDILGFDVYPWGTPPGSVRFPSPESDGAGTRAFVPGGQWLRDHINNLHNIMTTHGGPTKLVLAEMGTPQHGNLNPSGPFGYPEGDPTQTPTWGHTRDGQAIYLVKAHMVAIATQRVSHHFWYNYYDRGNDPEYPEDHFGLRMHRPGISGDAKRQGPPKPAYQAYATMVNIIDPLTFTQSIEVGSVFGYEFTGTNSSTVVAWRYPDGNETIDASVLGITGPITSIINLYGQPIALNGTTIDLDGSPCYITVSGAASVMCSELDINGDGFIRDFDIQHLWKGQRNTLNVVCDLPAPCATLDVNGDGFVSKPDLVVLRRLRALNVPCPSGK